MVRRTELRSRTDERAFPVRLRIKADRAPDWIRWAEAETWLNEHVGKGQWARHGTGPICLYLRTVEAAQRFMSRFAHFELYDLTDRTEHLLAQRNYRAGEERSKGAYIAPPASSRRPED